MLHHALRSESVQSFKRIRAAVYRGKRPEQFGRQLKTMVQGIDEIAITAYRNVLRRGLRTFGKRKIKVFRLANMSEQVPNPASRITLSPERDRLGQNCVRLDWRLSPIDMESVLRSQEILGEELEQAGYGRLYIELGDKTRSEEGVTGGWHQMGTTRMHRNPTKGVVDETSKVHGMSNLYIAGPSVFPTSGYANPSLTIVALSVRLADHVKKLMS
jgi:choline dehydrogenase-like flavoprotein